MGEKNLVIDDDYCTSMADYFYQQGKMLDDIVSEYIEAIENVRNNAIKEGSAAKALDTYLTYVKKLSNQISEISIIAEQPVEDFLTQVDDADEYLF